MITNIFNYLFKLICLYWRIVLAPEFFKGPNARIHKADVVKEVCDILNIELIYLPKYCPDLNPIEDVWRVMKKEVRTMKYANEEELIELCEKEFYEAVKNETLYEEWIKEYCTA